MFLNCVAIISVSGDNSESNVEINFITKLPVLSINHIHIQSGKMRPVKHFYSKIVKPEIHEITRALSEFVTDITSAKLRT